jgi:PEP-CTERM motif
MKTLTGLLSITLLTVSSTTLAIPIATVGSVDTLVDWGNPGSSDADEMQFIADYLLVDVNTITYTKLAGSGGSGGLWSTVDEDSSLWAFDFGSLEPSLFLIKTGANVGLTGVIGTFDHYLFSNLSELDWGVIDSDIFTRSKGEVEIGMISHVSTSGTGTTTVPEPTTLSLLGLGLLVLGFGTRKLRDSPRA